MEEQNEIETKKRMVFETVALTNASAEKIKNWIEQANAKKKGVKVSRKDFVNWLIEKSPENLSGGDLNALVDRFYDEERFLRQLLRDVKKAKESGQTEVMLDLVVKTKRNETKKDIGNSEEKLPDLD